ALWLHTVDGLLLGMVTRIADQKGLDLVLEVLPRLLAEGCRLALLGSGDPQLEAAFTAAAAAHPGRVAAWIGYSDDVARKIYAGADAFLMPSRYEPCGLGQLVALRYGTIPIVRRTGGLADTVKEFDPLRRTGTGFGFDAFAADPLVEAVRRAAAARREPAQWSALVHN